MRDDARLPEPGSTWVMLANTDAPLPVRVIRCSTDSGKPRVEYEKLLPDGGDASASSVELRVWQDLIANGQARPYSVKPRRQGEAASDPLTDHLR
jgi:hypothetical protein